MRGEGSYTDSEAEQILRLAANHSTGAIDKSRLLQMADELGLSHEAVQLAEQQVIAERTAIAERTEFDVQHRKAFFSHLTSYLVSCGGMVLFNLVTDHHITWAIWPIIGWGIGIAFHIHETFAKGSEDYEEEFQKWRTKRGLSRTTGSVTPAHQALEQPLENILLRDNLTKIEAIKRLREETGSTLKDAKDAVEMYERIHPGSIRS
ncbi:2TM domain-containing protein [Fimbriimonas ginsengisoli]|uniref:2TM domain-containing protein n=1 Tax=Fimbriimonas ginsengisoli TaxID=1005039 RepID=UPI00130DFDF9|nr:2TM domain-containing protein [Fimbriimonas ginsengisoli]